MVPPEPETKTQIRMANIISNKEWEGMVESTAKSGSVFRRNFMILIGLIFLLLVGLKIQRDLYLGVSEELLERTVDDRPIRFDPKLEKHYKIMKLDAEYRQVLAIGASDMNNSTNDSSSDTSNGNRDDNDDDKNDSSLNDYTSTSSSDIHAIDSDEEREARARLRLEQRLANYRLRKKLEDNFEKHQTEQGQLVFCGKECKAERSNVEISYNTLVSQVDRELYALLLDDVITKTKNGDLVQKRTRPTTSLVKEKYKEKIMAVYKAKMDAEQTEMALLELKDAYDILISDRPRTYYHLYGAKPPEHMKRTDATHGGWGHELALRTHRNRMVFEILDAVESEWLDRFVFYCLIFIGFIAPMIVQLPGLYRMAGDVERRRDQLAELERKRQQHIEEERERNRLRG